MEALIILLLIIILIIVAGLRGKLSDRIDALKTEIQLLREEIEHRPPPEKIVTRTEIMNPPQPAKTWVEPILPMAPPVVAPPQEEWRSSFVRLDEDATPLPIPTPSPIVGQTTPQENGEKNIIQPSPVTPAREYTPAKTSEQTFFEKYPDIEKFIGENLAGKIGIGILVIAIGFFVKFAIDKDWIGPAGRVGIGILCGGILVGLAHWMRNSYKAFSSVLTGGGLAVFYFTITLAYQMFGLFGQTTAFIIMLVITAFSVALSLLYKKQEVAIIALIGGFATPFMVSNGSGNYIALFSYLLILNVGLLVIAYYKNWRLLNLLAFIFTVILFGSWLATLKDETTTATYINALWFATAFYLLFFAINLANNIKENKKFFASDFGILLANTGLFFGTGLYCLTVAGFEQYRGLFSALLGAFNLAVSFILFRNKKVDTNILYLLIGLTLTFISLTAPVQLKGNNITLFWSCEAVLLYWLYQKSKIDIIRLSSLIVWIAMLLSLFMDWSHYYLADPSGNLPIISNRAFITSIISVIASFLLFMLRKKDVTNGPTSISGLMPTATIYGAVSLALLYITGALEINYQFKLRELSILYLLLYTYSFILIYYFTLTKYEIGKKETVLQPALLCICTALYLINIPNGFNIQTELKLPPNNLSSHFAAHWISTLLVGIALFQLIQYVRKNSIAFAKNFDAITWAICAITVIYLSVELNLVTKSIYVTDASSEEKIETQFIKIGLPILWGLCSFSFMWLGMHFKHRMLRIISLSLFALTLFKLFAYDILDISEGGKIAAFFCLGVLLLVISFMYQRLKKIIIDGEKKQEEINRIQ